MNFPLWKDKIITIGKEIFPVLLGTYQQPEDQAKDQPVVNATVKPF
jgi:hypothetical protein